MLPTPNLPGLYVISVPWRITGCVRVYWCVLRCIRLQYIVKLNFRRKASKGNTLRIMYTRSVPVQFEFAVVFFATKSSVPTAILLK